jgi:Hsp70 protein
MEHSRYQACRALLAGLGDAVDALHLHARSRWFGAVAPLRRDRHALLHVASAALWVKHALLFALKSHLLSQRPLLQARNEADQLIYSAEKNISDFKDKVTDDIVAEINTAMADLRGVKDNENLEELKAKTEALSKAVQKIGQHIAQQSAADQKAGGAGGNSGASGTGDKSQGG